MSSDPRIALLVEMLDRAYDQRSWHGPNLRGAIRGLDAVTAAWRPAPDRHNAWEHVVHAAYWKYVVRRRLLGEKRGSFSLKGSNWFARPLQPTDQAWAEDVRLLHDVHQSLRSAVASLPPRQLDARPAGSQIGPRELILGVASHDVYHAGQIQLLKRLSGGAAAD
jgi:hypothetical protein